MNRRSLLMNAAILGLLGAAGCATPRSPEEKEMKSINDAKVVDTPAATEVAKGECHGVNACKGKGDCGGPGYSCAGNNSCKGKGWLTMTEAQCKEKKGTFKP